VQHGFDDAGRFVGTTQGVTGKRFAYAKLTGEEQTTAN
jgi:hypothetical protein